MPQIKKKWWHEWAIMSGMGTGPPFDSDTFFLSKLHDLHYYIMSEASNFELTLHAPNVTFTGDYSI